MANKEPEASAPAEAPQPLTPDQRIDQVEKSLKTNRIILLVTVLMLLLSLGTSIAAILLKPAAAEAAAQPEAAAATNLANSKKLEDRIDIMLRSFDERLKSLQTVQDNDSLTKLFTLQTELEQDKQRFALGARAAIGDLARMVPGSRTWLEMYSEQINQGIERSKQRISAIQAIKVGLPDGAGGTSQPGS